jgi:hypothetical protein
MDGSNTRDVYLGWTADFVEKNAAANGAESHQGFYQRLRQYSSDDE